MVHFEKSWFGGVKINGINYRDVLVIGETVEPRDFKKLEEVFGRGHWAGDWEVKKLLANKPEIIIIGSGTEGLFKVTDEVKEKIKTAGVELKILLTPKAIEEFNRLYCAGQRVNGLIHTTC